MLGKKFLQEKLVKILRFESDWRPDMLEMNDQRGEGWQALAMAWACSLVDWLESKGVQGIKGPHASIKVVERHALHWDSWDSQEKEKGDGEQQRGSILKLNGTAESANQACNASIETADAGRGREGKRTRPELGVQAARSFSPQETLLTIPHSLTMCSCRLLPDTQPHISHHQSTTCQPTISAESAETNNTFSEEGKSDLGVPLAYPLSGDPLWAEWEAITALAAWILRETAKGEESEWHPYLESLPQHVALPPFAPDPVLELLQNEPLADSARALRSTYEGELAKCISHNAGAGIAFASKDAFFHACSLVSSRSFSGGEAGGGARGECSHKGCSMLVPLADLLNHSQHYNTTWKVSPEGFTLLASAPIEAGEELLVSYGSKSSDSLLLSYGFCPPVNAFDCVPLFSGTDDLVRHFSSCFFLHDFSDEDRALAAQVVHRLDEMLCETVGEFRTTLGLHGGSIQSSLTLPPDTLLKKNIGGVVGDKPELEAVERRFQESCNGEQSGREEEGASQSEFSLKGDKAHMLNSTSGMEEPLLTTGGNEGGTGCGDTAVMWEGEGGTRGGEPKTAVELEVTRHALLMPIEDCPVPEEEDVGLQEDKFVLEEGCGPARVWEEDQEKQGLGLQSVRQVDSCSGAMETSPNGLPSQGCYCGSAAQHSGLLAEEEESTEGGKEGGGEGRDVGGVCVEAGELQGSKAEEGERQGRQSIAYSALLSRSMYGPQFELEPISEAQGGSQHVQRGLLAWPQGCFDPRILASFTALWHLFVYGKEGDNDDIIKAGIIYGWKMVVAVHHPDLKPALSSAELAAMRSSIGAIGARAAQILAAYKTTFEEDVVLLDELERVQGRCLRDTKGTVLGLDGVPCILEDLVPVTCDAGASGGYSLGPCECVFLTQMAASFVRHRMCKKLLLLDLKQRSEQTSST